jgi:hypothetical protein
MHWDDMSRQDAITMLREAIKELEEHPERFLEYQIRHASISEFPRTHAITVVFEIPEPPEESEV